MTSSRHCKLSADVFCYICGYYIAPKQLKHPLNRGTELWIPYAAYFGMKIRDQDKSWSPIVSCGTMEKWLRGARQSMRVAKFHELWREPSNHVNVCYFCMVDITTYKKPADRSKLVYPDIPSSIAPVPHSDQLPVPIHQPHHW